MKKTLSLLLAMSASSWMYAQDNPSASSLRLSYRPWYIGVMSTAVQTGYPSGNLFPKFREFNMLWGRLSVGKRIAPALSFEVAYSRGVSKLTSLPEGKRSGKWMNIVEGAFRYHFADGTLLPIDNRWDPYVILRGGGLSVPTNVNWAAFIGGGIGVDFWVVSKMALSAMVTANMGTGEGDKFLQYGLGLRFRLGKKPQAVEFAAVPVVVEDQVEEVVATPAPKPQQSVPASVPTPVDHTPAKQMSAQAVVHFTFNNYELDILDRGQLQQLAQQMQGRKVDKVVISGYTDNVGTPEVNKRFAMARAQNVKRYLVSQGVQPEVIEIKDMGDTDPTANNASPEGRALNRRVVIDATFAP